MKTKIIIGLAIIIFSFVTLVAGIVDIVYFTEDISTTEKVDCYDKYNNRIIGEECLKEEFKFNKFSKSIVLGIIACLIFMLGAAFIIPLDINF